MSGAQQAYPGFMGPPQGDDRNNDEFFIESVAARLMTNIPAKVLTVYPGNASTQPTKVDVQIMVDMVNSQGKRTPHKTLYGLPAGRHHGGTNAVLIDPVVGDVGLIHVCHRDIQSLINNQGAQSGPGSARRHDLSDAVFWPGLWTAAPTNYTDLRDGNHRTITNQKVYHNSSGSNAAIIDTAQGSSVTNTRTNDPVNAESIVDKSAQGSNNSQSVVSPSAGTLETTNGSQTSSVVTQPNAVTVTSPGSISLSAPLVALAGAMSAGAGSIGSASAGGGAQSLAPSNGTTTPSSGIGQTVGGTPVTGVSLSGGGNTQIATVALTAGVWMIWGNVWANHATTYFQGWATTDATGNTYSTDDLITGGYISIVAGSVPTYFPIGVSVQTISASTTFYLFISANFSGSMTGNGVLTARRIQ